MNILEAADDPALFRPWFKGKRENWAAWRSCLAALFGLPMEPDQRAIFTDCTGLADTPADPASEAWLVCGRRSGKTLMSALVAVYLAMMRDWKPYLAPGERATILILASDRRQARSAMRYVRAMLERIELFAPLVERVGADEIELTNEVNIEISAASFRSVRGYTVVCAICDEIAFWRSDESANPDTEILDAMRPAMATVPNGLLLCISSPYAQRGALWNTYRRWFGREGGPLIWRAPTWRMNPTVPRHVIDEAYERDQQRAAAEFGAEFRTDLESFVAREVVDACTEPGRRELPPVSGVQYVAFVDPSGGSADSMTLAIAHAEGERAVLDLVREAHPPFSPDAVVQDFAETLKAYHVTEVEGDRYAGLWPTERFDAHGIKYRPADQPKSALYLAFLPHLNSGTVELLDLPRLAGQLTSLERRTAHGGRDSVDHPPGAHDDVVNAAAGALLRCAKPGTDYDLLALVGMTA